MKECFVVMDLSSNQIYGSNAYFDRDEAEEVMEKLQERYPKANWITMQLSLRAKRTLEEITSEDVGSIADILDDKSMKLKKHNVENLVISFPDVYVDEAGRYFILMEVKLAKLSSGKKTFVVMRD